jgi:hypothetical protein
MRWHGRDFMLGVLVNASFSDGILDGLDNGENRVLRQSDFSICLKTKPHFCMRVIFIVNQSDLEKKRPLTRFRYL